MPNKRPRRSAEQMQRIRDALYQAALDENPVTGRRLFYRLVTDGIIEKTEAEYQGTVIRLLGVMREDGTIPFDWIADHTRLMRKPRTFDSLSDALGMTAEFYRRALWAEQACRVEIWCEKTGLTGVLYPVTSEWDVPLMICGGSPSKTFLYGAAEQIVEDGKPTHIYYLGDHDPSGVAIRNRVERDLRRYASKFLNGEAVPIYFEQLAVTPAQILEWKLPTRPTKQSDPNARRFEGRSIEVDAVSAVRLRDMVETSIEQHIDAGRLERLRAVEQAEQATLKSIASRWTTGASN